MDWIFYKPLFEFDELTPVIRSNSAWTGHLNFAYDLVRFVKPKTIVELGTHFGASFFSFCQGVKDGGIAATCFAVDTWKGDNHTGPYSGGVFHIVEKTSRDYYDDMSVLLRTTFDEAVTKFEDETIDILHIDGYHTFEAVNHDYNTWLPKLAKNGVVLFHDIAVKTGDFGVYKLWDKLKSQYPHLQFEHSYGLGVLFPKGCHERVAQVMKKNEAFQHMYM